MNYVAIDHITPVLKRVVPGQQQAILSLLKQHEVQVAPSEINFMRSPTAGLCRLTAKEKVVCAMLLQGKSYREIAEYTKCTYRTIVNNTNKVMKKTNCHSRLQLVYWLKTHMSTTFPD